MKGWTPALYNQHAVATLQQTLKLLLVRSSSPARAPSAFPQPRHFRFEHIGTQCGSPAGPMRHDQLNYVTLSFAVLKSMNEIRNSRRWTPPERLLGCQRRWADPELPHPASERAQATGKTSRGSPSPAPRIHRYNSPIQTRKIQPPRRSNERNSRMTKIF